MNCRRAGIAILCFAWLPACAGDTAFYRLRLELTTTSDWTALVFKEPLSVLSVRQMAVEGQPRVTAGHDRVVLMQPLASASAGEQVGVTVDVAFAAHAAAGGIPLSIEKGGLNRTSVRVSLLVGEQFRVLREFSHGGNLGPYANAVEFRLNSGPLTATPPLRARAAAGVQRRLWALYFQWYDANWWTAQAPYMRDRPDVLYSSADPNTIIKQIAQAQGAGIDGFLTCWLGPGTNTDRNFNTLLDLAKDRDFSVALSFDFSQLEFLGPADKKRVAFEHLSYAIRNYRDRPAYFKVEGKPLAVIYTAASLPPDAWAEIFATLRAQALDAVFVGWGGRVSDLDVFDGVQQVPPFGIANPADAAKSLGGQVHRYPFLDDAPRAKYWMAAAAPGFDDRLLSWSTNRFWDREDGALYRSYFDAAIQSDPDWILIDNWNEWWENAYIEPGLRYGDQYLTLTRELANKWKAPVPAGQCEVTLTPTAISSAAAGGYFTLGVQTSSSCAWQVEDLPEWIDVYGDASGTGSGSVTFRVGGNSGASRTARATIGGLSWTVTQDSPGDVMSHPRVACGETISVDTTLGADEDAR